MRVLIPAFFVGVLLSLLATPLAAASACSDTAFTTKISDTRRGQVVRNAVELSSALKTARGGETLLLAPGNYRELTIGKAYRKPVTIRSANPKNPACFTGLRLTGAEKIILDRVVFDYSFEPKNGYAANRFHVKGSTNISFSNCIFDGDKTRGTGTFADGLGSGKGLVIAKSAFVTIRECEFRTWWTALIVHSSTDITIDGNNIHSIRSDGMKLGRLVRAVVSDNWFHDFRGNDSLGDHRDMIQIQRSSSTGVQDLTIRDNVFDMGTGSWTQTIWAGRDKADPNDPTNWHQKLLIENNIIYNAHTHGISVNLVKGLTIRRNSVIRVSRTNKENITIPKILVSKNSRYVVIEQNATSVIGGYKGQPDWIVLNNAIIQDTSPSAPGYYDRQFVYYARALTHGHHEYGVRHGSLVDRLNAGSTLAKNYPSSR